MNTNKEQVNTSVNVQETTDRSQDYYAACVNVCYKASQLSTKRYADYLLSASLVKVK